MDALSKRGLLTASAGISATKINYPAASEEPVGNSGHGRKYPGEQRNSLLANCLQEASFPRANVRSLAGGDPYQMQLQSPLDQVGIGAVCTRPYLQDGLRVQLGRVQNRRR